MAKYISHHYLAWSGQTILGIIFFGSFQHYSPPDLHAYQFLLQAYDDISRQLYHLSIREDYLDQIR